MGISEFAGRKVGKWYWWAAGGAVLMAPVLISTAMSASGGEDYPADEARVACEAWVRDELKAPATATFNEGGATGTDGDWTVTGTVDAENSFGANLRTSWTCDARVEGDDWVGAVTLD